MLLISLIVFLPTLGALCIAFMPSKKDEDGVNEKENQNMLLGAIAGSSVHSRIGSHAQNMEPSILRSKETTKGNLTSFHGL